MSESEIIGWLATQDDKDVGGKTTVEGTIVFVTITRSQYIEVTVPGDDAPQADPLVDLTGAIKQTTSQTKPCASLSADPSGG